MAETKPAAASAVASKPDVLQGNTNSPFRNTLTIAGREFRGYFNTPMGYIVIAMFSLLIGVLFFYVFKFLVLRVATLKPLFDAMSWLMPLLAAAISMRTFAEERRLGTIELLITMPVRDGEVIVGKFLGAIGLLATTLAATFVYPIWVSRLGDLDMGPVVGGYLGLFLGGASYISIGMLASSYSRDQISAFFVTFFIGYFLFLLDKAVGLMSFRGVAVLEYISFDTHFRSISLGKIDTRDIVYFCSVIGVCLLATSRSLASRRWS